ncbi:LLM class flavin-dependent oxidoreductase [[Mycobacterium] vasticus]|uniref:LLM class flavin-dependent oxidoreductase n=1 Tax=[Mycobacterium] vasticus TaxID=2875777 RepID=A0ABU5Z190_9MYCO|nr:LLM class flavin-dependent oxidoreductase [Mycolicibacter sp. MYC017]MEB3071153.1 LLM class flavin-dependent oxidoreductase [Mycolicibacter sp. MYC017]
MANSLPPFEVAVQSAVAAEAAGFDFIIYWDQMCMTMPSSIVQPDITSIANVYPDFDAYMESAPLVALAAAQTSRIEFGYGPLDVVRRHPSMLAQTLNTLDHVTGHRIFTILANGENKQMKPYGISRKGASDKLHDALQMLNHWLTSNEPLTYQGRLYKANQGKVALQPLGDQRPGVLVAGGGKETLEAAGRYGEGWMTYLPGSMADDPDQYAHEVSILKQAAVDGGRDPDQLRIMPIILSVVHEDPTAVTKVLRNPLMKWNAIGTTPSGTTFGQWGLEHPLGDNWIFSRDCIPPWMSREETLAILDKVPEGAMEHTVFAGNAEQVYERIKPWLAAGVTDAMILNWAPFAGVEHIEGAQREEARLIEILRRHQ